jgi:hypothetical protein
LGWLRLDWCGGGVDFAAAVWIGADECLAGGKFSVFRFEYFFHGGTRWAKIKSFCRIRGEFGIFVTDDKINFGHGVLEVWVKVRRPLVRVGLTSGWAVD